MPQRFLRPGITNSDAWNSVSFEAQSLYIRMLTLVDDFGRYDGRVPVLHGQCFALRPDIKPQRTAGFRSELQAAGLIDVYEVGGKEFIQVTKWTERARGDKSKFPDKPEVTEETPIPQDSAAERSGPLRKDASIDHRSSPLHPRHTSSAAKPREAGGISEGTGSANLPTTPQSRRIAAIMHRRETTPWQANEVAAYKLLGTIPEDDLAAVEGYYAANWPPCRDKNILRHDLLTLLHNFQGEVGRAYAAKQTNGRKSPQLVV